MTKLKAVMLKSYTGLCISILF